MFSNHPPKKRTESEAPLVLDGVPDVLDAVPGPEQKKARLAPAEEAERVQPPSITPETANIVNHSPDSLTEKQKENIEKLNPNQGVLDFFESKKETLRSLGYKSDNSLYELLNRKDAKYHLQEFITNSEQLKNCPLKFTPDQIIQIHRPASHQAAIKKILSLPSYFLQHHYDNAILTRIASHTGADVSLTLLTEEPRISKLENAGFTAKLLSQILNAGNNDKILALTFICIEEGIFEKMKVGAFEVKNMLEGIDATYLAYLAFAQCDPQKVTHWLEEARNLKQKIKTKVAPPKTAVETNPPTTNTNANNQQEASANPAALILSDEQKAKINAQNGNASSHPANNLNYEQLYECGFRSQLELFKFMNDKSSGEKLKSILTHHHALRDCAYKFDENEIRGLCAAWGSIKTIELILKNIDYFITEGFDKGNIFSICRHHSSYRILEKLICKETFKTLKEAGFTANLITPLLYRNRSMNSLALTVMCIQDGTLKNRNLYPSLISLIFSGWHTSTYDFFDRYLQKTGKEMKDLEKWAKENNYLLSTKKSSSKKSNQATNLSDPMEIDHTPGDMQPIPPESNTEAMQPITVESSTQAMQPIPAETNAGAMQPIPPESNTNIITVSNIQLPPSSPYSDLKMTEEQMKLIQALPGNKKFILTENDYRELYEHEFRTQDELFEFINTKGARKLIDCLKENYKKLKDCDFHFKDSDIRELCAEPKRIDLILTNLAFFTNESFKYQKILEISKKEEAVPAFKLLQTSDNLEKLKKGGLSSKSIRGIFCSQKTSKIFLLLLHCIEDGTIGENKLNPNSIFETLIDARKPITLNGVLHSTGKTAEQFEQWLASYHGNLNEQANAPTSAPVLHQYQPGGNAPQAEDNALANLLLSLGNPILNNK